MSKTPRKTRPVSDEMVLQYYPLVEKFLKKYVVKNWNEASMGKNNTGKSADEVSLGNSGMSMADMRQHLRIELFIGLSKYDPEYRTKEGKPVKEITFLYTHLYNRIGQLMKRLVKDTKGYGVWTSNLEEVLFETDRD